VTQARSQAQKDCSTRLKNQRFAAAMRKRRRKDAAPVKETLEQYLAAGGRITQCEAITGDPAAAIARAKRRQS
jgi:hypothetical protein